MTKKAKPGANDQLSFGSHQEQGKRARMEDRLHVEHVHTADKVPLTVAIVADGIGGEAHGDRAAELTVATILNAIQNATLSDPRRIPALLKYALEQANHKVFEEARTDREKRGMGSTATVAAIHAHQLYLANVGDSRAYLVRKGEVKQLTRDHTWRHEMLRQKLLTPRELEKHPKAEELARSIGFQVDVLVDLGVYTEDNLAEEEAQARQGFALQTNDRLLLCSDGLIKSRHNGGGNYVEPEEIERIVTRRAPQEAAVALVQTAIQRAADDNVSAIVLEMPGSKRAFYLPPVALYAAGGLLGLLLIVALGLLLRGGDAGAEAPPTLSAAAGPGALNTAPPGGAQTPGAAQTPAGRVRVTEAAAGASWQAAGESGVISAGAEPPLYAGAPLTLQSGTGVLALELPHNAGWLFLAENTTIEINTVAGVADAATTMIVVQEGSLVVEANQPASIANRFGSRVRADSAAVLGVTNTEQPPLRFEAACLTLGPCIVVGDQAGSEVLTAGQGSFVGGGGSPADPEAADYAAYHALAPGVVPAPTATATPTETPTPTKTPTNTPTRRPAENTPTPRPTERPSTTPAITPPTGGQPPMTIPPATYTPEPIATETTPPPPPPGG